MPGKKRKLVTNTRFALTLYRRAVVVEEPAVAQICPPVLSVELRRNVGP